MPNHPHSTDPLRPPRPASGAPWLLMLVVLLLAAGAAWWFWLRPARLDASPLKPSAMASAPQAAEPLPAEPEPTGPQNLIEESEAEEAATAVPLPVLAESDGYFSEALAELVGKGRMGEFLLTDGLVRRAVATVDNLAREQAPARMWPVQPMPGRFTVEGAQNNVQSIAESNAGRYSAAHGTNVVVHEFAHKLDMQSGTADGCPPLPAGFMGTRTTRAAHALWWQAWQPAYDNFREQVLIAQRFGGMPPWLDSYGATAPAEFFAVACEAYFVNRNRFAQEFPVLLGLLDKFFRPGVGGD